MRVSRDPFRNFMGLLLSCQPTEEALREWANKSPDRYAQAVAIYGRLCGYGAWMPACGGRPQQHEQKRIPSILHCPQPCWKVPPGMATNSMPISCSRHFESSSAASHNLRLTLNVRVFVLAWIMAAMRTEKTINCNNFMNT